MAIKKAGFVDEHIEKVALGLCAVIVLGAIWLAFLSGRFAVEGKSVDDICRDIGSSAERTAATIKASKPPSGDEGDKLPRQIEEISKWYGPDAEYLVKVAGLRNPPGRTQPFAKKFTATTDIDPEDRHNLAKMEKPGIPIISTGRTMFVFPAEKPSLELYTGDNTKGSGLPTARNWVTVAAQVDLVQQEINYNTERYPEGSFPIITQVELQRLDESEPWRGWQKVDSYVPFQPPPRPTLVTSAGLATEGLLELKTLLEKSQEYIAHPKLPARDSGDKTTFPPMPYLPDLPSDNEDPGKLTKQWLKLAERAITGKRPFDKVDLDAAWVFLRAVQAATGVRERELTKANELMKKKVQKPLKKKRQIAA